MGAEKLHDVRWILVGNEAEVQFHEPLGGQYGLAALALVPAAPAVDVDDGFEVGAVGVVTALGEEALDAEGLLEVLLAAVDAVQRGEVGGRGFTHLIVKAGDQDVALVVPDAAHRFGEAVQGVVDDCAEAAVQVAVGEFAAQFDADDALEAQADNGPSVVAQAAEFPPAAVGPEFLLVRLHELDQAGAADLLLAFDEPLDPDGQFSAVLFLHGANGGQARGEFALVVACAASVQSPVAFGQHEGGTVPEVDGVFGLHVVVVVDQQRERPFPGLGQQDGGDLAGEPLHGEALGFQQQRDGRGGFTQHAALRRDALQGDEVAQVAEAAFHVGGQVGSGHALSLSQAGR